MTREEKVALCSGATFWKTKAFLQYDIPGLFMCDGPHGLRKQENEGDHLGLNASVGSTCFPTASAAASTWDAELLQEMGDALGKEAVDKSVNVILGPGVNMKRSPLCGRNFEYYSEDPYLSGKLAAAWINGVQQNGVGTSLKHFAGNSQEQKRMSSDSLIDERALREYYLPAFEIAVKEAQPETVMCAYNRLNGTYCSDNRRLLTEILREEWGFEGAVVTDWGAMNDRIEGFRAGLDLEMPGSRGCFDAEVLAALADGTLDESYIDSSVQRLWRLIERTTKSHGETPSDLYDRHHELARKIATAGAVLLKNDANTLPLAPKMPLSVIGALAKTPRYQGTGSSLVTPMRLDSLLDGLNAYTSEIAYAQGYTLSDKPDKALLDEAVRLAQTSEQVVLCIGLTDIFESEGYDREGLSLPKTQLALLDAIGTVGGNIIVVLVGGSAVEMPWLSKVSAVLHMQLSGQAGGLAAADLLFGRVNPSGKLTESYPLCYDDVISSEYYGKNPKQVPYYESMFCGYRYFDTAEKDVLFPFGYGLSYTRFAYADLQIVQGNNYQFTASFTLKNTGAVAGSEIAQLYIAAKTGGAYRPSHELKGFAKIFLKPGDEQRVNITLDKRSFAIYDSKAQEWVVESGDYEVQIGASSREIKLCQTLTLEGKAPQRSECSQWYYTLNGTPRKADFVSIYEKYEDFVPQTKGSYDMTNSIRELAETSLIAKIMYKAMESVIAKGNGGKVDYGNAKFRMLMDAASDNPMKSMTLFSPDSMPLPLSRFFVDAANGHTIRGLWRMMKKRKDG